MYDYTIVPSEKIKQRMDYFYTPYNQKFLLRKHMTFEDQEAGQGMDDPSMASRQPTMHSCLSFMHDKSTHSDAAKDKEKAKQTETED